MQLCAVFVFINPSVHPTLDVYTGFTPSQLMTSTCGCIYSL